MKVQASAQVQEYAQRVHEEYRIFTSALDDEGICSDVIQLI